MLLLFFGCAPSSVIIGGDTASSPVVDTADSAEHVDDSGPAHDSSPPDDTSGDTSGDTSCDDIPADDAGYAALFDPTVVHAIALTLSDSAMTALAADPSTYVNADVVIDGASFPGVGVKWRGDSAQERWDGKPGFKIGLRAMDACATVAGLSRLSLDAMVDDPAQGRLVVSNAVFEAAGLPAPKAAYTTVSVNGDGYGLYANVEVVDGSFVARRWTTPGGVLWEGGSDADFTARGLHDWSDVDSDGDDATIAAVAAIVQGSEDDFYTQADTLVDMDQFLSTWAMLAAIGHLGAYPYDTGDTYLYADPTDGRFRFVAWGLDAGWDPTFGWNYVQGSLALRCVYDTPCAAALRTHLDTALTATDALDVPSRAAALFAVSASALAGDERRGTTAADVTAARQALLVTMAGWPAAVRAQIGG